MKRKFINAGEQWYNHNKVVHEIYIRVEEDHHEGRSSDHPFFHHADFTIKWVSIFGKLTPKLVVFSDAFSTLQCCTDLIEALVHSFENGEDTIQDVIRILKELDFEDITKRVKKDNIPLYDLTKTQEEFVKWVWGELAPNSRLADIRKLWHEFHTI